MIVAVYRVNIPSQPPPTWNRGGGSWIYDSMYGTGRRPTTGVWGPGEFPPSEEPAHLSAAPNAPANAAQVRVEQVLLPNGKKEEVVVPAAPPAAAGQPGPTGVVENIVLPNGKQEQVVIPAAAAAPTAAPVAAAPAPASFAQPIAQLAPAGAVGSQQASVPVEQAPGTQAAPGAPPAGEGCNNGGCPPGPVTYVMQAPAYGSPVTYAPSGAYGVAAPPSVSYVMQPQASQQLPMEWAAEDAAEHAYNLAQWRVKILKAKMDQAKLRKELMQETVRTPSLPPAPTPACLPVQILKLSFSSRRILPGHLDVGMPSR